MGGLGSSLTPGSCQNVNGRKMPDYDATVKMKYSRTSIDWYYNVDFLQHLKMRYPTQIHLILLWNSQKLATLLESRMNI